ncbi:MAG TPA: Flp family type IVb pilin [Rhodopila sp.]|nr:Flp family type IVb pilin [Rhodopila sp.]
MSIHGPPMLLQTGRAFGRTVLNTGKGKNPMVRLLISQALAARTLANDRRGVTALEYGLIASLVAIAIVTAITTFGSNLSTEFSYISQEV